MKTSAALRRQANRIQQASHWHHDDGERSAHEGAASSSYGFGGGLDGFSFDG